MNFTKQQRRQLNVFATAANMAVQFLDHLKANPPTPVPIEECALCSTTWRKKKTCDCDECLLDIADDVSYVADHFAAVLVNQYDAVIDEDLEQEIRATLVPPDDMVRPGEWSAVVAIWLLQIGSTSLRRLVISELPCDIYVAHVCCRDFAAMLDSEVHLSGFGRAEGKKFNAVIERYVGKTVATKRTARRELVAS
jgi:hypothetical protein